jgi:16S rRNA (uracil1498-N3)-methyltransferase
MTGLYKQAASKVHDTKRFLRLVLSKRAAYWTKSRSDYCGTRISTDRFLHSTCLHKRNPASPSSPPSLHRFYVHPEYNLHQAGPGTLVQLSKEESQHVAKTLRLKPGNHVELCDGRGFTVEGEIVYTEGKEKGSFRDKKVLVQLVTAPALQSVDRSWQWTIAVGCGSLKGGRGDWLVEKVTELGAAALLPLSTIRSPITSQSQSQSLISESSSREGRWRRVANAAMKQCLRAYELDIQPSMTVNQLCESITTQKSHAWVANQWSDVPAPQAFNTFIESSPQTLEEKHRSGILIIGPEGDFTEEELGMLKSAGARPVYLGPLRLRTETAAIAMLSFARLYLCK